MKAILLDGYGTLVQITDKRNPFRHLGEQDRAQRRHFYERALTTDLAAKELLEPLGLPCAEVSNILDALNAEVSSIKPFDEAKAFLSRLEDLGIPWLIVSNLAQPYCQPLIDALGISALRCRFSCVTGLLKPDPKALLQPCTDLDFSPADVLMIGDSLRDDVGGAQAAGLSYYHLDRQKHTLWDVPGIGRQIN
ncbi:HAD family hydrolase [Pseudomonas fluorescens]|uniref:HAD family hydrolase n=1 Tax=Pseudomonas TaxID=286 RepID=UPI000F02A2D9|nr:MULTISPECIES: HAD family hydrolase [Pseudomonas]MBD8088553.1 HAD family hydrolase [Pseudomonas fluorescens]MBD8614986.1 HAD family hydrolase [Pseudomonas putida]MBD8681331.1 HAD family hydrolase [Pseudomonas sp. CFBP 13719]